MKINDPTTVEAALAFGEKFHAARKPAWPWDEGGLRGFLASLASNDDGFLAVSDGGFIAGLIMPYPVSREWLVAHESLWWSEDGRGIRLLNAFRKWAKSRGVNEIIYSCPPDAETAVRVFSMLGPQIENTYSEVSPCV